MKGKILALALTLVLALSLVACGGGGGGGGNSDKFEYGNGSDYIANNLKGDYSITYRYSTNSSEDYLDVTCARTSAGYYYSYGDSEVLYIKNGNKYDTYFGSTDGGFAKIDLIEPKTEDEVKDSFIFVGWMSYYGAFASNMTKDGSTTIAGRNCDRYKYSWSYLGTAVRYVVCIDKSTGVCLKYTIDTAAGGEKGNLSFECTEFKTSGVSLPAYN